MKQGYFLFILFKWKKLEHIFMLSSQRIKLLRGLPGGSEAKASTCNVGNLGLIPPLEKEMAIHSSILAWEIPWTEEPGGLQSMGSKRVRHN